jgi:hypothetical protein
MVDGAVAREGVREADAMLRRHWLKVYGESDMGEWHNRERRLRTPRSRALGRVSRAGLLVKSTAMGCAAAVSEASSRGVRQAGKRDWGVSLPACGGRWQAVGRWWCNCMVDVVLAVDGASSDLLGSALADDLP